MIFGDFRIYHGKKYCLAVHKRGCAGISSARGKVKRQRKALNQCVDNLYKYRYITPGEIFDAFSLEPRHISFPKTTKRSAK